jgi:phage/plasmid-like protein (TIGR03299 family)
MAHELYSANGRYAYSGRLSAWHNLGQVTGTYQKWDEIAENGGLDFAVEKRCLHLDTLGGDSIYAVFRTDTGACLGSVGEGYEVIQHQTMMSIADVLTGDSEGRYWETAGVLGAGQVVWGLVAIQRPIQVGESDLHKNYMLFSTSHDGSRAFEVALVNERVVCANTLRIASNEGMRQALKVYHTQSAGKKLDGAEQALLAATNELKKLEDRYNFLATRMATADNLPNILQEILDPKKADRKSKGATQLENRINAILDKFEYQDGGMFPEQRGTLYNLLNAVTEVVDHGGDGDRSKYATFGAGDRMKSSALAVITKYAEAAPAKTASTPKFLLEKIAEGAVRQGPGIRFAEQPANDAAGENILSAIVAAS